MLALAALPAQTRAALPIVVEDRLVTRESERRRMLAALVPRVVLRFTWRSERAGPWEASSSLLEWPWPVALGATFEVHALWRFDLGPVPAGTNNPPEPAMEVP